MTTNELELFFQNHGFQVHLTEQNGIQCAEVESWTDGGVDMIIWLNPFTKEEFIDYVKDFDIDEEIERNRQNKEYRTDFTLSQSVNDFTKYKRGLIKLSQILEYGSAPEHTVKMKSWLDQLLPIIEEYKSGSDEPLTIDEVDDLIKIIKAKINLHECNITDEEYNRILG